MSKHDSIKSFFQDMSADLLAGYFYKQGHLQDFDFSNLNAAKIGELFGAWLYLPEAERKRMEDEFHEIYALNRDAATPAIIHEATWQMREKPDADAAFIEMFSTLPNHYERDSGVF